MVQEGRADEEMAGLVERTALAASAIVQGDMRTYLSLIHHAEDYTLMAPFGGPVTHGFDGSEESVAAMERFFAAGEVQVELVQSYASGDLVVLVMVEHQHAAVGGLPDQDWSLRVTLVFRRDDGDWKLVHRHADPLVARRALAEIAELARG
jgi:ketosteroid isomerase-like protein